MSAQLVNTLSGSQLASPSSLPKSNADMSLLEDLRRDFEHRHYVRLPGLLPPALFSQVRAEVDRLEHLARPKDFTMEVMYHTPRIMTTLGGQVVRRASPLLNELYDHPGLRGLISHIVGCPVYSSEDINEWMVCNWLSAAGQTHGWHLDDPPLALIIFLESPKPEGGGVLEYIPDWHSLCAESGHDPNGDVNALVTHCRAAELVQERAHAAGDAYLLRADTCLHRVTAIKTPGARRVALNLAFELQPDVRRKGVTAALLYDE